VSKTHVWRDTTLGKDGEGGVEGGWEAEIYDWETARTPGEDDGEGGVEGRWEAEIDDWEAARTPGKDDGEGGVGGWSGVWERRLGDDDSVN
jgi:hypothetical protein